MCKWLLNPSKKIRRKPKSENRLPVDEAKLNMGNTYSSAPEYYYDIEFTCVDCGIVQNWTAKQQKWWYEEAGGYFFLQQSGAENAEKKRRKGSKKQEKLIWKALRKNKYGTV